MIKLVLRRDRGLYRKNKKEREKEAGMDKQSSEEEERKRCGRQRKAEVRGRSQTDLLSN